MPATFILGELNLDPHTPFALFHNGMTDDASAVVAVTGTVVTHDTLSDIEAGIETDVARGDRQVAVKTDHPDFPTIEAVSLVPYAQIRERGFAVHAEENTPLRTLMPLQAATLSAEDFYQQIPDNIALSLSGELTYNFSDDEFATQVQQIIDQEIRGGRGCNFLLSRQVHGQIDTTPDQHLHQALSIFRRLLQHEYGCYMTFLFYDGERYAIGASPERQVTVRDSRVSLNPISGTLPKTGMDPGNIQENTSTISGFLNDPKEKYELIQVLEEEMKMMAVICPNGGRISPLQLKEMSRVFHTEYHLNGESDLSRMEIFRRTMFCPTMIGGPLQSAAEVLTRYEAGYPRGYYTGAFVILGRDKAAKPYLDSAIAIRTLEMATDGQFKIQSGATVVQDSVPAKEATETSAKVAAMLGILKSSAAQSTEQRPTPILTTDIEGSLQDDVARRDGELSRFWFEKQKDTPNDPKPLAGKRLLFVHNEDDFAFMSSHILTHAGATVEVRPYNEVTTGDFRDFDGLIIGPGPGDPTDGQDPKIQHLQKITKAALEDPTLAVTGICLGHQIVCKMLGLELKTLPEPTQGRQIEQIWFGKQIKMGHYNSFYAQKTANTEKIERLRGKITLSRDENGWINGLKGSRLISFQGHPESVLSIDGHQLFIDAVCSTLEQDAMEDVA